VTRAAILFSRELGKPWNRKARCPLLLPTMNMEACMIGDLVAGWIGNRIDRSDGEGGVLGAALGVVTWKVVKGVVPAALFIGGAALGARYLAKRMHGEDTRAPT
jgi:hypothetical protein